MLRHRFKQIDFLRDRLALFAKNARHEAESLAPGMKRDDLLRKARRADTAAHIDDWAYSPGLQPPK